MNPKPSQAGFTLFEMVMAASILAVIIALAYPVLSTGTAAFSADSKRADLDRNADRAIHEIAGRLAMAGSSMVYPDYPSEYGSSYLMFYQSEGYADGNVQWGPVQAFYFEYTEEDWCDGVDNDGDGLVDEGQVSHWTYDYETGEPRKIVLARNVREYLEGEIPNGRDDNGNGLIDEHGFAVTCSGNVWTIRLSIEKPGEGDDSSLIRTVETAVAPRNQ